MHIETTKTRTNRGSEHACSLVLHFRLMWLLSGRCCLTSLSSACLGASHGRPLRQVSQMTASCASEDLPRAARHARDRAHCSGVARVQFWRCFLVLPQHTHRILRVWRVRSAQAPAALRGAPTPPWPKLGKAPAPRICNEQFELHQITIHVNDRESNGACVMVC